MKTEQYKLLGVNVSLNVPESVDEAVQTCGADKVLSAFVDHVVYHTIGTLLRTRVAAALEEQGFGTRAREKGESGNEVVVESPAEFIARLKKDGAVSDSDLEEIANKAAAALNFAEVVKGRVAQPKQPSPKKTYLGFVQEVASQGRLSELCAKLSAELGRPVEEGDLNQIAISAEEYFKLQSEKARKKLL
jgi:hypothetical protein